MNIRAAILSFLVLTHQVQAMAADAATTVSPTSSILKMVMGLAVVLAVMALISWVVKRMMPSTSQHSAIKVVGGASVGSRERVVVLEVADRWLVVGVAQGQVSAIANLAVDSDQLTQTIAQEAQSAQTNDVSMAQTAFANPIVKPFSAWLKKSTKNIKTKG